MSSSRGQSKTPSGTRSRASRARQAAKRTDLGPPKESAGTRNGNSKRSAGLRAQPSGPLFSSKPRPSGTRRLSDIPLDEDEVLIDSFDATLDGVAVRVTAVLERTCVYVDRGGDRRLASKKDLWVDASELPIRRRGIC